MQKEIKIIVAIHKECEYPQGDIYLPLQVGAENSALELGLQTDNTGDNISALNPYYCELTGLYWGWKNLDCDYMGLVQYRRFFTGREGSAIQGEELASMTQKYKVFVPKKRRYYIETIEKHYIHTHDKEHIKVCREVMEKEAPEYIGSFNKVMNRKYGYMFNMMVMEKRLIDDYCGWIFPVLDEIYKAVDSSKYSDFDRRFIGRISEILFNVWLDRMLDEGRIKDGEIKELPYSEDVNWSQKIKNFLAAKFLGKKYEESSKTKQ